MRSEKYSLNGIDWRKSLRDLAFFAAPAVIGWMSSDLIPYLEKSEYELVPAIGVPFVGFLVALGWRFFRDNTKE